MGCVREGHTTCDSKAARAPVHAAHKGIGRARWLGQVRTGLASLVCCLFVLVGLDCILIWWPASAKGRACVTGVRGEGVAMASTRRAVGVLRALREAGDGTLCVLVLRAVAVGLW